MLFSRRYLTMSVYAAVPHGESRLQGFIQGSVNVPLYRPIEGWDAYKVARRVGYALFGVLKGTEPNPNFMQGAPSPTRGMRVQLHRRAHAQRPRPRKTLGHPILSNDGACIPCCRYSSYVQRQFQIV